MKPPSDRQSTEFELRERVKELACLYAISELSQMDNLSMDRLMGQILALIPPAWQFPEQAAARIVVDHHHFVAPNFRETQHKLSEKITLHKKQRGVVEVVYLNGMPEADEGPFLKEERKLLKAIAGKLALVLERKEAQEEKERLSLQIRHADRLATIGELTAGIAHEINEPLANILGFAQLASKNEELPGQARHDLDKIIKAALTAREIIKKLMYFSHQMPQRFSEVDLNGAVRETLQFLESRFSKEKIAIHFHLTEGIPPIYADSVQLNQVIVNLVLNAIQAMPNGGDLKIYTGQNAENVMLAIEDSGIGIPESIRSEIFKPFFTTKEPGKGTGLGLSVLHGIITSHEAEIRVESEEGKGARFEIKFPIKKRHVENEG